MSLKFIIIDGKRIAWRDILKLRKEQKASLRRGQSTLFELHTDIRPVSQQSAAGRFVEPTLFEGR